MSHDTDPSSDLTRNNTGQADFIARHNLWSANQSERAGEVLSMIKQHDLHTIRLSFADQHGILRGKSLTVEGVPSALRNGINMTTTLLLKDISHRTVLPAFNVGGGIEMEEFTGAGDFVLVPDPTTFRILPWADGTGWMLCDIYFTHGGAVPFSTRQQMRNALTRLNDAGYDYFSGIEVEFHIFKKLDPKLAPVDATQPATPPDVELIAHGFQYLTESRADEIDPIVQTIRRDIAALGLPIRSMEVEFGPSQVEMTFAPGSGLESADLMILFRSAVKQICARHGYHATFMCRPGLPNIFSSGWHLHQCLLDKSTGQNAFIPQAGDEAFSSVGRKFAAGLLRHARAGSVFSTPTINGYKRFRPYSLAPDRVLWARDNRGVMLRVLSGPGDPASRIENRAGEPGANPYLYMASQIHAGLDGIENNLEPGPLADTPYETEAPRLPQSLMEAIDELKQSDMFRAQLGSNFVDYLVKLKEAEIARFLAEVTDWEHKEYFEQL